MVSSDHKGFQREDSSLSRPPGLWLGTFLSARVPAGECSVIAIRIKHVMHVVERSVCSVFRAQSSVCTHSPFVFFRPKVALSAHLFARKPNSTKARTQQLQNIVTQPRVNSHAPHAPTVWRTLRTTANQTTTHQIGFELGSSFSEEHLFYKYVRLEIAFVRMHVLF